MKRIVVIMSLLSLLPLWSCARSGGKKNDAHIMSFSYHFDGTRGGNSHNYDVRVEDDKAILTIEEMAHQDYGEMTDSAGMDFMEALEALCRKHGVQQYDGFNGYDRDICDGKGFSLSIRYDNGTHVNAHGMNDFPMGYGAFEEALHELFRPYCERMRETALQKKKAQGVSGELTFIMMNFIQQGESGRDKYEVMLSRSNIRKDNFEVRIHSVSGEFLPKGDYQWYTAVSDETIDWNAFAALVKKYDLMQWMDYHQSAEDYNNSEWFQMAWTFEEGSIHARGTAHPEHYEAFRRDFLQLLKKNVEKVKREE